MTGYNIQSQKNHAEKDRKHENKKNLIKIVVNLFWEKNITFLCSRPRNLVLFGSVFQQRRGNKTQISLAPYFWLQIGW